MVRTLDAKPERLAAVLLTAIFGVGGFGLAEQYTAFDRFLSRSTSSGAGRGFRPWRYGASNEITSAETRCVHTPSWCAFCEPWCGILKTDARGSAVKFSRASTAFQPQPSGPLTRSAPSSTAVSPPT